MKQINPVRTAASNSIVTTAPHVASTCCGDQTGRFPAPTLRSILQSRPSHTLACAGVQTFGDCCVFDGYHASVQRLYSGSSIVTTQRCPSNRQSRNRDWSRGRCVGRWCSRRSIDVDPVTTSAEGPLIPFTSGITFRSRGTCPLHS